MMKRPIDRKRDAGGIMEIGTPDDQSAITAIFPIGDDLFAVKERGIYEVRLADRIDPIRIERTLRSLTCSKECSIMVLTLRWWAARS
jgi:hypothetical protein